MGRLLKSSESPRGEFCDITVHQFKRLSKWAKIITQF